MRLHDEVRIYCKVRADKPRVVGSGWINRSSHRGIGIVHQVLVLAHKCRTPISEVRSGVGVKHGCLNEVGMDREDYLIF